MKEPTGRWLVVSGCLFMTQPKGHCFGWTKDRGKALVFTRVGSAHFYASSFFGGDVVLA